MTVYKLTKNLLAIIGLLSILAGLFIWYLNGEFDFLKQGEEIGRLSSPDNEYDAVLIKYEPMAFSTPRFDLFIVPYSEKYAESNKHFKWSKYKTISLELKDIKWENNRNLIIERNSRQRVYEFDPIYHDLRYPIKKPTHTEYRKVMIDLITRE